MTIAFPLHNDSQIDSNLLLTDERFLYWAEKFTSSGNSISSVRLVGAICNGDRIHSFFIEVKFSANGINFIRSLLLRGRAVVVIPLIRGFSLETSAFLTVKQIRISTGSVTNEFPSGGCDCELPIVCALRELHEETGIKVDRERLVLLRNEVVVCESAFDEVVTWYLLEINACELKVGSFGDNANGEITATEVLNWNDLSKLDTFHMLAARTLLREYYHYKLF